MQKHSDSGAIQRSADDTCSRSSLATKVAQGWQRIAACGLLACLVAPVSAGTAVTNTTIRALVSNVQPGGGGVFLVYLATAPSGMPSCAAAKRFAIDPTTPAGQAMIALVLSSYATGSAITVVGTGTCSVVSDTETVSSIETAGL